MPKGASLRACVCAVRLALVSAVRGQEALRKRQLRFAHGCVRGAEMRSLLEESLQGPLPNSNTEHEGGTHLEDERHKIKIINIAFINKHKAQAQTCSYLH